MGSYEEVPEAEFPGNANFISSHVVFKINTNYGASLKLKFWIVVHGNLDANRNLVSTDSSAADMILVLMLIILAALMVLNMSTAYIKGAYVQIGPIQ